MSYICFLGGLLRNWPQPSRPNPSHHQACQVARVAAVTQVIALLCCAYLLGCRVAGLGFGRIGCYLGNSLPNPWPSNPPSPLGLDLAYPSQQPFLAFQAFQAQSQFTQTTMPTEPSGDLQHPCCCAPWFLCYPCFFDSPLASLAFY